MMVSARKARKTPLPATWNRNAAPSPPPPPPPRGTDTRSAIPRSTGIPTSTASSSRLRHRRKISPSSERSIRSHGRTTPRRAVPPATGATPGAGTPPLGAGARPRPGAGAPPPGACASPRPGAGAASAVDIEALSGEFHEQVLQAGPWRVETGHRNLGQYQGAVHRFRRVLADLRADLAVAGPDVRQ